MTEAEKKAARELALANWESAALRNLAPFTSDGDALVAAIQKNRTTPDADAFARDMCSIPWVGSLPFSTAVNASIAQLRTLIAADAAEDTNHA